MITKFKSNVKNMGAFLIKFNWGSMNEGPGNYGISHLIEHCLCNKLKDLETDLKINGIKYNAWTSTENVVFHISGIDKNIKDFRIKFYNAVINYQITEDVFERERNIVIQELENMHSDQDSVFFENLNSKYFNLCSVGGLLSNLKNLTFNKFMEYKNRYYSIPDEIVLTSKYDLTEEEKAVLKTEDKLNLNKKYNFNKNGYNTFELIDGPVVENNRVVTYMVPFKSFKSDNYERFIYYKLFAVYMNDGLTSPLYYELREKHRYVYGVHSALNDIDDTNCAWYTTLKTLNENCEGAKKVMMECFEKEIKKPSIERFRTSIKSLKNSLKTDNYLSYFRINTKMEHIFKTIETYKFNFKKFKQYIKEFYNSEYILTDDISIKNGK